MNVSPVAARCMVVIPAYREAGRVGPTVTGVRRFCPNVVVVDDGSGDKTAEEAASAGAEVIRHERNMGKGASLDDGIRHARSKGYEVVVTMDGDGQHAPSDLPAFMDAYAQGHAPVLVGNRMANPKSMPLIRKLTNWFMSWLLSRRMSQWVPDTQCGYRLYACAVLDGVSVRSGGFAADSEILLALAEKGVRMGAVPIEVIYRDEKSKIRPFRDTIRFFRMLRRYDVDARTRKAARY